MSVMWRYIISPNFTIAKTLNQIEAYKCLYLQHDPNDLALGLILKEIMRQKYENVDSLPSWRS